MTDIKKYEIPEDIVTFYVKAESFPEGIQQSYNRLEEIVLNFNKNQNDSVLTGKSGDDQVYRAGLKN